MLYRKFLATILAALGFSSCGHVHNCLYGPPALYGGPPPDTIRSAEDIEELYACPIEEYDDSLANDSTSEAK